MRLPAPKGDLHGVAYDGRLFYLVLFYEGADVLCHGRVVMAGGMGRVTVVAQILMAP
jgi:hypothetical protein